MIIKDLINIIQKAGDKPVYFKVKVRSPYKEEINIYKNVSYGSWRGSYDMFSIFLEAESNHLKNLKKDIDDRKIFYGYKGGKYTYDYDDEVMASWDIGYYCLEDDFRIIDYEEQDDAFYIRCVSVDWDNNIFDWDYKGD